MIRVLFIVTILVNTPIWASNLEDYKNVIAENVAKIDSFKPTSWQYQRISHDGKIKTRESFDPSRNPNWQLISIDERKPNSMESDQYIAKLSASSNDKNSVSIGATMRELIDISSLGIISVEENIVTLFFTPKMSSLQGIHDKHLKGNIKLDMKDQTIKSIHIENIHPIKPKFYIKLNEFSIDMEFIQQNDHILVHKLKTRVLGKFGFIKTIHQENTMEYINYTHIAKAT